jgi:hypothetical protein
MGPGTEVYILQNDIPVSLSDIACHYYGLKWMNNLTVNAMMEIIAKQYDRDFLRKNAILTYDTLICVKENQWSERPDRLECVKVGTRKIFHILCIVNHFVLFVFEVITLGTMVYLKGLTYNPLNSDSYYSRQTTLGQQKLQGMIETRLKECHHVNNINVLETNNIEVMQQGNLHTTEHQIYTCFYTFIIISFNHR